MPAAMGITINRREDCLVLYCVRKPVQEVSLKGAKTMVNTSQRGGMKTPGTKQKIGVRAGSTAARKQRTDKEVRHKLVPDSKSKRG
jgi:hypothetical protein